MNRNLFLDYLKGIAIFLVVWGHAIQHLNSGYDTSKNAVFMFIYSFHMPLFMTISGYLFAFSKKRKDFALTVNTRFRQLLLPLFCWTLIPCFLFYYKDFLSGNNFIHTAISFFKYYLSQVPYYLWFLWSLFSISVLVSLIAGKFKDKVIIHILVFILLLGCTDRLGLMYIKFMYPYFLFGYFYNLYRDKFISFEKPLIYLSFIVFPVLLFFWSKEDLIYQSGMSIYKPHVLDMIICSAIRYAIGFTGIVVVVTILKKSLYFPQVKFIDKMGNLSLGIYIMQTIIFSIIDLFNPTLTFNSYVYTGYALIISILIIIVSMFLTGIISKIPVIGKVLFGGRY